MFLQIGMMSEFGKDECQGNAREIEAGDWAKGSRISPLEQRRIVKSLKPVLSDCTPLNIIEFCLNITHFLPPPSSPSTPSTRQAEYQLTHFCFNTTGSRQDLELWENSSMQFLNRNNWEVIQVLSEMTVWLVQTNQERLLYQRWLILSN